MTTLGTGFRVGHWTDREAMTGCTVILPPAGNVASCDIRGSSPGSREIESLKTSKRLTEIHGLLLTGGSAYGLGAADGVMSWLAERGVGYDTPVARIPIVPSAVVFDLGMGRPEWPRPEHARTACDAASEEVETGRVGAGTGCTVGKWAGREHGVPGGLGVAEVEEAGHRVAALAVVNAIGDVMDDDGSVIAGTTAERPASWQPPPGEDRLGANTVLAVLVTSGRLDKRDVRFLAARGSDGVTVAVRPAHTRYDGDVVFAIAGPDDGSGADTQVDILGVLATAAVAEAVRNAVR
jgi:L-aminopeptidase/D-esterase-like protein